MSDSSSKRVLLLSCGQSFPPVFPEFFRNFTGMYEFLSFLFWNVGYGLLINFPVFKPNKMFFFSLKILL